MLGTLPIVPLCVLRRAQHRRRPTLFLGPHLARDVDLGTGDVAVHVDAARHDDQAGGVQRSSGPHAAGPAGGATILPSLDPDVAHLAVDAVDRIVDVAAGDFEQRVVMAEISQFERSAASCNP